MMKEYDAPVILFKKKKDDDQHKLLLDIDTIDFYFDEFKEMYDVIFKQEEEEKEGTKLEEMVTYDFDISKLYTKLK